MSHRVRDRRVASFTSRPDQPIREDVIPRKYSTVLLPTSPTSPIIWYKSPPRYITVLSTRYRQSAKQSDSTRTVWTQPVECIRRSEIQGKGREGEKNGWSKKGQGITAIPRMVQPPLYTRLLARLLWRKRHPNSETVYNLRSREKMWLLPMR
jgi:hypothetical protein